MTAPLALYLVRHGETAWSLTGQHTGRTDLALTDNGEAMSRELAPALQGIRFTRVLSSPRLRARSTCALAGLARSAQVEPDLAEWDYGDHEGLRTAQIRQQDPGWDLWTQGCPGGETAADVAGRADRLINRLRGLAGGPVALFTHGQFGRVLALRWVGLPVSQGRHLALDPASVSILGLTGEPQPQPVIALWNASASGTLRPSI